MMLARRKFFTNWKISHWIISFLTINVQIMKCAFIGLRCWFPLVILTRSIAHAQRSSKSNNLNFPKKDPNFKTQNFCVINWLKCNFIVYFPKKSHIDLKNIFLKVFKFLSIIKSFNGKVVFKTVTEIIILIVYYDVYISF